MCECGNRGRPTAKPPDLAFNASTTNLSNIMLSITIILVPVSQCAPRYTLLGLGPLND